LRGLEGGQIGHPPFRKKRSAATRKKACRGEDISKGPTSKKRNDASEEDASPPRSNRLVKGCADHLAPEPESKAPGLRSFATDSNRILEKLFRGEGKGTISDQF